MKAIHYLKRKQFELSVTLFLFFFSQTMFADDALPWETPLDKILSSLSGPVAKILGVIAIIIAGFGIAFGEAGSGVRRLFQVIFGLSIVFSATSLVISLFGVSGVGG